MATESDGRDKRLFPRAAVRCPVVYWLEGSRHRSIGLSIDFSATGLKMFCKDAVAQDGPIHVELKPGANRDIPGIVADGQVVRCEPAKGGGFLVSCKLLRVHPPKRPANTGPSADCGTGSGPDADTDADVG